MSKHHKDNHPIKWNLLSVSKMLQSKLFCDKASDVLRYDRIKLDPFTSGLMWFQNKTNNNNAMYRYYRYKCLEATFPNFGLSYKIHKWLSESHNLIRCWKTALYTVNTQLVLPCKSLNNLKINIWVGWVGEGGHVPPNIPVLNYVTAGINSCSLPVSLSLTHTVQPVILTKKIESITSVK